MNERLTCCVRITMNGCVQHLQLTDARLSYQGHKVELRPGFVLPAPTSRVSTTECVLAGSAINLDITRMTDAESLAFAVLRGEVDALGPLLDCLQLEGGGVKPEKPQRKPGEILTAVVDQWQQRNPVQQARLREEKVLTPSGDAFMVRLDAGLLWLRLIFPSGTYWPCRLQTGRSDHYPIRTEATLTADLCSYLLDVPGPLLVQAMAPENWT